MNFKNKKTFLISIALLAVAVFIFLPARAHADLITSIAGGAIGFAFGTVSYIVGFIGGLLFSLAGWFVDWALYTNSVVTQTPVVKIGWAIARDLANLCFVLVILIIAFATALRIEEYGMKKLLGKLILMAFLINFSLVIAGVFIDFAGVITEFFISRASISPGQMATALATAFAPQRLMKPDQAESSILGMDLEHFGTGMLTMIAGLFFTIFFTVISLIAMLALGVMLFVRFIVLTFLLILAPLAWVLGIIPGLSKYTSHEWWDKFIKWTFFAPATSFFIYLAIMITNHNVNVNGQSLSNPILAYTDKVLPAITGGVDLNQTLAGSMQNPAAIFGQMIAVIGILIGGMIAADKIGISVARSFVGKGSLTEKFTKGMGTWAGRRGSRLATLPFRAGPLKNLPEGLEKFAGSAGTKGGPIRRMFGKAGRFLSTPVREAGSALSGFKGLATKQVAAGEEKLKKMPLDEQIKGYNALTLPERLAFIKNGKGLDKIPFDSLSRDINQMKRYGMEANAKELYSSIPTLDKDIRKNLATGTPASLLAAQTAINTMLNQFKPEDFSKLQFKAIKEMPRGADAMEMIVKNLIENDQSAALAQVYKLASRTERRNHPTAPTEGLDVLISDYINTQATAAGQTKAAWLAANKKKINKWQGKNAMGTDWGL